MSFIYSLLLAISVGITFGSIVAGHIALQQYFGTLGSRLGFVVTLFLFGAELFCIVFLARSLMQSWPSDLRNTLGVAFGASGVASVAGAILVLARKQPA